jgi:hypothetical protein
MWSSWSRAGRIPQEMDRHDLLSNVILASASDCESRGLSADEVLSMSFHWYNFGTHADHV